VIPPETAEPTVALTNLEAIPLAAAMVSDRAEQAGIRALVIKGLVVEHHGLRPARGYADVDVIVDPVAFDAFTALLGRSGWHPRTHLWVFDKLEVHSLTLVNDNWPCDIDVHARFPGFLAPDQVVFEELWSHRFSFDVAHRPIIATDAAASAAILGLHALRRPNDERNARELVQLATELRKRPDVSSAMATISAATGSIQTLGPLLDAIGVPRPEGRKVSRRDVRAWKRRTEGRSRAGQWITYLSGLPLRRWPRELRIVVWPPRELYLQEHPATKDTPAALFTARARRVLLGIGDLWRMLIDRFRSQG